MSSYYVDIKSATSRPDVLRVIAREVASRVEDADVLAGVELGAVPILAAVSLEADLPFAIIRKKPREHGTGRPIEGAAVAGRRVLLIEDVTTTGGSVAKAIELLREAGAKVERVVTVVDRGEGAAEALAALQARLEPLVSAPDLLALSKEARA